MSIDKSNRITIYQDTIDCIKNKGYEKVNFEKELGQMLTGSKFYQKVPRPDNYPKKYDTIVYAQNIDCLQKAIEFKDSGVLLNMASRVQAGGGVTNGALAQEEEIFRRTTLSYSLYRFDPAHRDVYGYQDRHVQDSYPVYGDKAGFWSPGVLIFKKGATGFYDYLSTPVKTNVITIPAVRNPELNEEGEFKEKFGRMWRSKIRSLLRIALMNGKTKLVLGAFGCGAYHNPPKKVAKVFKEVLSEDEFIGVFEEICFAILDDKNSPKGGNYRPFADEFGTKTQPWSPQTLTSIE